MIILTEKAIEESTYIVSVTFTDEAGAPVTPASIVLWELSDINGVEIASGSVVAAASVDIVLTGAHLVVNNTDGKNEARILVIKTTYNSSLGTGLYLKTSAGFVVENLVTIPGAVAGLAALTDGGVAAITDSGEPAITD